MNILLEYYSSAAKRKKSIGFSRSWDVPSCKMIGVVSTGEFDTPDEGSKGAATAICDVKAKPASPARAGLTTRSQPSFLPLSAFRFSWVLIDFWVFGTKATVDGMQAIANTAPLKIFIAFFRLCLSKNGLSFQNDWDSVDVVFSLPRTKKSRIEQKKRVGDS